MSPGLEDEPLIRTPDAAPAIEEPPPPASAMPFYAAIAIVGLLLGGYAAWRWTGRSAPPPSNAAARNATEAVIAEGDTPRPLPPLGEMDTFLRALIGALSSRPELARWLATEGLIRQMADAIDKSSRGQSPAANLTVLAPQGIFEVRGRRESLVVDPASYTRYDGLAAVVSSLDAGAVARAYKTIQPRLDEAYRALGRTDNSVDQAVRIALETLLATPVVQDPIRLVPGKGATYAYAEPRLESLAPVQKQLLRMGPENVTRIQTRLREIRDAIAR